MRSSSSTLEVFGKLLVQTECTLEGGHLMPGQVQNSGLLQPKAHSVLLAKDLDDIDAVVQLIKDDRLHEHIVRNARRDIVQAERFSIDRYPNAVIGDAAGFPHRPRRLAAWLTLAIAHVALGLLDALDRLTVRAWVTFNRRRLSGRV